MKSKKKKVSKVVVSNSEDKHIPFGGIHSRIYAKNLLVGDKLVINNNKYGTVSGIKYSKIKNTKLMTIKVLNYNKKIFVITCEPFMRVTVKETIKSRKNRRDFSRNLNRYSW